MGRKGKSDPARKIRHQTTKSSETGIPRFAALPQSCMPPPSQDQHQH
jgi:hypothetical protein